MERLFIIFFGQYLAWVLGVIFAILFVWNLWRQKNLRMVLEALGAAIISRFFVTEVIRFFHNRPRPFEVSNIVPIIPHDLGYSFPSGHATFFFALGMSIFLYDRRWGTFFLVAAVLMGIARIIAGVHWPSDIIGGAIIGVLTSLVVHYFAQKLQRSMV